MVEVTETALILHYLIIFLIFGVAAHLSAYNGYPRVYFLLGAITAFPIAVAFLIYAPQLGL